MGNPWAGLAAGVASHAAGDMIPHREAWHVLDTALTAVALVAVALAFGWASAQMAGAIGGALPDVEHVLKKLGVRPWKRAMFPTHNRMLPHPHSSSYASQIACGLVSAGLLICQRALA